MRPCCPVCDSFQIRKRHRDSLFKCGHCRQSFAEPKMRYQKEHRGKRFVRPKPEPPAPSPNRAPYITIGRGYRWGSGLV
jgi:hypothetical protein